MFDNKGNLRIKKNNNYKSTEIIAGILEDRWVLYYSKFHNIIDLKRPNYPTEVQKITDRTSNNLGTTGYVCNDC